MHKIGQSEGFLGKFLRPLLNTGCSLIKNVLKPLAKIVLIPLGLIAPASATDSAIHKNVFGSGTTILVILNEEMNDVIKIVKSLEESGLLIKRVSELVQNEAKEQKGGFVRKLLDTLGASLLGNLWTSKEVMKAGEDTVRAGQDF